MNRPGPAGVRDGEAARRSRVGAAHYVKRVGYSITPVGDFADESLTGRRDEPSFRLGYLSVREFGYALAYYARLRGESAPPWARHLLGDVWSAFTRGVAYPTTRQE